MLMIRVLHEDGQRLEEGGVMCDFNNNCEINFTFVTCKEKVDMKPLFQEIKDLFTVYQYDAFK